LISNREQQVDDFVGELTFSKHSIDSFSEISF